MRLEQSFEVSAGADEVFRALGDLERVAPCFPGARIVAHDGNGTYEGELNVGLARLRGTLAVTERDAARRTLRLRTSHATAVLSVADAGGTAHVHAAADIEDGRLAFFEPFVQDLAGRLLRDFGACLTHRLSTEGAG